MPSLHPLLLEPIYLEKVWGGRRLEGLGRALPGGPDAGIGESWEVADLAETSVSGGGGGAARSVVRNGPLAGRVLGDLLRDDPAALLGEARADARGGFPLLVKYLDAKENLSVQVHPSPAYARAHPDAHLKSEAWYVVDAGPGATIYKGVRAGVDRDSFERSIAEGTVADLLVRVPAVPGACHYLPSGTCHALGAGVLVAEVQTPSDTTFRVYDWGRTDRTLHVAQALECIDYGPVDARAWEPDTDTEDAGRRTRALVRCEHFGLDEWRNEAGTRREVTLRAAEVWMVVQGRLTVSSRSESFEPVSAGRGETLLLPGSLGPVAATTSEPSLLLRASLPGRDPDG